MPNTNTLDRRLLDCKGITEYRGISERFARRLLNERRLPVVKLGRRIFVWSHDLDAYLEANTLPVAMRGNS
jgi:excisionase family DNA binding protein